VIEEEKILGTRPFKPYRSFPLTTMTEKQFAENAIEEDDVKIVGTSNRREIFFTDPYYYSTDALNHRQRK
jgi:hypothetical protein